MPAVRVSSIIDGFADRLLAADLPQLATERRALAVEFIRQRADSLPSITRLGVGAIGALYCGVMALPGGWVLARVLASKPLPLLAEYPRLIRSLGYAYVWEQWPTLLPTGAEP
jgi:hypothetical protein